MVEDERDIWAHLVEPLCSMRSTYSWMYENTSKYLLNTLKDRDYTGYAENLFQCSVTFTLLKIRGKKKEKMFADAQRSPSIEMIGVFECFWVLSNQVI